MCIQMSNKNNMSTDELLESLPEEILQEDVKPFVMDEWNITRSCRNCLIAHTFFPDYTSSWDYCSAECEQKHHDFVSDCLQRKQQFSLEVDSWIQHPDPQYMSEFQAMIDDVTRTQ